MASRDTNTPDRILEILQQSPKGLLQRQIAERLNISKASTSKALSDLINKRLVKSFKDIDPESKRPVLVYLLQAGDVVKASSDLRQNKSTVPLMGRCCRCQQLKPIAVLLPRKYCKGCAQILDLSGHVKNCKRA